MRASTNRVKEKHRRLIEKQIAAFEGAGKEVYEAAHGESGYKTLFHFGERAKADWRTRNEQTKASV